MRFWPSKFLSNNVHVIVIVVVYGILNIGTCNFETNYLTKKDGIFVFSSSRFVDWDMIAFKFWKEIMAFELVKSWTLFNFYKSISLGLKLLHGSLWHYTTAPVGSLNYILDFTVVQNRKNRNSRKFTRTNFWLSKILKRNHGFWTREIILRPFLFLDFCHSPSPNFILYFIFLFLWIF